MRIPKKISPDRIRDAIVEFKYSSKIPFEVVLGLFFHSLNDSYYYTNRPLNNAQIPLNFQPGVPGEITLPILGQSLFYNDKIKFQIQPNSIIFNCLNSYIGWNSYKTEIENVLNQLSTSNVIERYDRVGIRYISEYPDKDLQECINFTFSFGMKDIKSDTYSFHSEFNLDGLRVILNLNNRLPVVKQKELGEASIIPVSLIDIDVIWDVLNEQNLVIVVEKLEKIHLKEKEVFFNLLNENFLNTLNPEY